MKKRIHMEERTSWAWWVHLLFLGIFWGVPLLTVLPEVVGWGKGEMGPVVAMVVLISLALLPVLIYTFLGQLRVRVTDDGVEAAWGFAETFKKRFPYGDIVKAEAATYSPMREFGGWGIRFGLGNKKAWTTRGNRALVLHLKDGARFYLSSEKPERLVMAIQSAGAGKTHVAHETAEEERG